MQAPFITERSGLGQEGVTPDALLGGERALKDDRTTSPLWGDAGHARAALCHLFPSIISSKKEWEHSHTKNGGGVRCSSSLRQDMQAIYSSRECKQTRPCPTVPAGRSLSALASAHLVPARGQATRLRCPHLSTEGPAPAEAGGHRLGTIPQMPLSSIGNPLATSG